MANNRFTITAILVAYLLAFAVTVRQLIQTKDVAVRRQYIVQLVLASILLATCLFAFTLL